MNMRPASTAWFELLTTHEDLTDTLEALAHTGSIQLELHGHAHMQMDVQDLQARLGEYNRMERSYKSIWPEPDPGMSPFSGSSAEILDSALTSLRAWEKEARPKIQQLDFIKGRIVEMDILHRFLSARLPGYVPARHLGGVGYLFVRGMAGPSTPVIDGASCGVMAWHPPAALVVAASELLGGVHA